MMMNPRNAMNKVYLIFYRRPLPNGILLVSPFILGIKLLII